KKVTQGSEKKIPQHGGTLYPIKKPPPGGKKAEVYGLLVGEAGKAPSERLVKIFLLAQKPPKPKIHSPAPENADSKSFCDIPATG
ncbi:hypothetical protein, partial [Salmonella enterica]|uniref:hypothetical protein n=1 Tax=Salmonella enterica TaxID=28901 RepID=UPI001A7EE9A3